MKGSLLTKLGPMVVAADGHIDLTPDKIDFGAGNIPLVSYGGTLTCQTPIGTLTSILHPYYDNIADGTPGSPKRSGSGKDLGKNFDKKYLGRRFCQAVALLKLDVAWHAALDLDKQQFWLALSGKALELLNVELACKIYRQLGDAGMVNIFVPECSFPPFKK